MKQTSSGRWKPVAANDSITEDIYSFTYAYIYDRAFALYIAPTGPSTGVFLIDQQFVELDFRDVLIVSTGSL